MPSSHDVAIDEAVLGNWSPLRLLVESSSISLRGDRDLGHRLCIAAITQRRAEQLAWLLTSAHATLRGANGCIASSICIAAGSCSESEIVADIARRSFNISALEGWTMASAAASSGMFDNVRLLAAAGAPLRWRSDGSVLHYAAVGSGGWPAALELARSFAAADPELLLRRYTADDRDAVLVDAVRAAPIDILQALLLECGGARAMRGRGDAAALLIAAAEVKRLDALALLVRECSIPVNSGYRRQGILIAPCHTALSAAAGVRADVKELPAESDSDARALAAVQLLVNELGARVALPAAGTVNAAAANACSPLLQAAAAGHVATFDFLVSAAGLGLDPHAGGTFEAPGASSASGCAACAAAAHNRVPMLRHLVAAHGVCVSGRMAAGKGLLPPGRGRRLVARACDASSTSCSAPAPSAAFAAVLPRPHDDLALYLADNGDPTAAEGLPSDGDGDGDDGDDDERSYCSDADSYDGGTADDGTVRDVGSEAAAACPAGGLPLVGTPAPQAGAPTAADSSARAAAAPQRRQRQRCYALLFAVAQGAADAAGYLLCEAGCSVHRPRDPIRGLPPIGLLLRTEFRWDALWRRGAAPRLLRLFAARGGPRVFSEVPSLMSESGLDFAPAHAPPLEVAIRQCQVGGERDASGEGSAEADCWQRALTLMLELGGRLALSESERPAFDCPLSPALSALVTGGMGALAWRRRRHVVMGYLCADE